MRLGAWLLSKGKITEEQLQRALHNQQFFGGRIGSSLIRLGFIDEDTLGDYLSDVSGTPYAPPSRLDNLPAEVLALVPARLAAQYRAVPLAIEGRRLRLAMRDPKDLIALDEIAFLTGMTIEPMVATDYRIQQALQRYYQVSTGAATIQVHGAQTAAPGVPGPGLAAAAPVPARAEIGLDGYPLDADPEQISGAFAGRGAGAPPVGAEEEVSAAPTSLQKWRMAQRDIPEEFPDPPAAAVGAGTAAGPVAAAAVAALPQAAPPQPVPAPESPLDDFARRLQKAETRDEVFGILLDFASARFQRCGLFIVHADKVSGWSGRGLGIDSARVRQVAVPLDRPSLFTLVRSGADHSYGPVSDQPANTRFFLDLGIPAPERALLVPMRIKDRPTVVLYADDAAGPSGPPDIPILRRLLAKAALALEIIILKNKILSL